MDILIKGMSMPKNGKYILCSIRADGKVITDLITGGCEEYEAIELPPHGDLIDRDALSKSLDALCDRVCQYSKAQRKVMCSACPLGDAFAVVEDDAPTIIESEGEG